MVKSSVLTPILSGVLAVSVAGSGAFIAIDQMKKSDKASESNNKAIVHEVKNTAVKHVEDKINAALDTAEQAIKGELDFAYDTNIEFEFGDAFTDELGTSVKPFTLKTKTAQKGGLSKASLTAEYGGERLATGDLIADNENGVVYLRCAELNEDYLCCSKADFENYYNQLLSSSGAGVNMMSASTLKAPKFNELKEVIDNIDYEALYDDFAGYVEAVKDALPEGKEKDNISGDINGYEYDYAVKTVEITGKVVQNVVAAVVDRAADDAFLKDYVSQMGVDANSYDKMIESLRNEYSKVSDEELVKSYVTFDVYYDNDNPTGFNIKLDNGGFIKLILMDEEDAVGIDFKFEESNAKVTVKGAFGTEDNIINGSLNASFAEKNKEIGSFDLTIEDLQEVGDNFSGKINLSVENEDREMFAGSIVSNSTEDTVDITIKASAEGKDLGTLKITGESTDASDFSLPSGKTYNPLNKDEMEAYMKNCDTEGFMNNIKSVIGEDVFKEIDRQF